MVNVIRVLLVDDHELARQGLRRMLELQPDMEVVGEASSAEEALELTARLIPDIVLMDIKMPTTNGLEATRLFKEAGWRSKIIILSLYGEYLVQALESGASGYLIKDVKRDELADAIRQVYNGELVLGNSVLTTPGAAEKAIKYFVGAARSEATSSHTPDLKSQPKPQPKLTEAETSPRAPEELKPAFLQPPWQSPIMPGRSGGSVEIKTEVSPVPESNTEAETASVSPEASDSEETFLSEAQQAQMLNKLKANQLEAELLIPPPVDAAQLLEFCQRLRDTIPVDIVATTGTRDSGTRIKVTVSKSIRLLDILSEIPFVAEASEEQPASTNHNHWLRLPFTSKPASAQQRIRLVLKPPESSKQLPLTL